MNFYIKDIKHNANNKTRTQLLSTLTHSRLKPSKKPTVDFDPRSPALASLERNLNSITSKLRDHDNYKQFFWTPDLSVCGFGTAVEIKQTLDMLRVDPDYSDKFYGGSFNK